jgi:hypothetical protein
VHKHDFREIRTLRIMISSTRRPDGLHRRVVSEWEFQDYYQDREDSQVALKVKTSSNIKISREKIHLIF